MQKYPQRTLTTLHTWAHDDNAHVRRLVSEGTRPRLPWASQLPQFIKDPTPTLDLLEHLKHDPSQYVRRSVANHLNDISKDHPALVIATLQRWQAEATDNITWITRHALRTLIKQGHSEAMALLGYAPPAVTLLDVQVTPATIHMGETFELTFTLAGERDEPQPLLIDYVVHFVKANGTTSPKVFKLTQRHLNGRQHLPIPKKHTIKPITTRRYYSGQHRVEIQVNGRILGGSHFHLTV